MQNDQLIVLAKEQLNLLHRSKGLSYTGETFQAFAELITKFDEQKTFIMSLLENVTYDTKNDSDLNDLNINNEIK